MISNKGHIKNISSGKLLRGSSRYGYTSQTLKTDDGNIRTYNVHLLVARAFIPNDNPGEKTIVNHKDENKSNPSADNLEWVTPKENANYGTNRERIGIANSKPVNEYDLKGKYIRTWRNANYPADIYNVTPRLIQSACVGKTLTAYGRQWRYLKTDDTSNIQPVKNRFALKYNKNVSHDVTIPEEYLYTVKTLTEAQRFADMLEEMIRSASTPKCFISGLKKVHDYLLQS